jgi:DNA polymerase III subunit epsilon
MSNKIVALDVETATRYPNSLCQISLILVANPPVSLFTSLIQPPENEFDDHIIRIHGIHPDMTKDVPTLEQVWPLIKSFLDGANLVAHNASFDRNVISKSLEYYSIKMPKYSWDCTYQATGKKLLEACKQHSVSLDNHHDSAFDALACARLYSELNKSSNTLSYKASNDFSELKKRRLAGDVLKKNLSAADPNAFFYDKKVVFTGVLDAIDRKLAASIVKDMGADIDLNITKKTKYVICGDGVGPSKMRKIEQYNTQGCDIKKLNEKEFLNILKDEGIPIN